MLLLVLFVFQVKHFLCDFVFQTEYQIQNKSIYGHSAGLRHAGLHIVGSIPAFLLLSAPVGLMAVCLVGEFAVHYHMDWLKARYDGSKLPSDHSYWVVFGIDQFVHQTTYLAMVFIVLSAT